MKVRLSRGAEIEYDEALEWYAAHDVAAALELDTAFEHALARLEQFPEIGPRHPRKPGYRALAVQDFPYVIVYQIRDHEIVVAAIAHTSRRPDYWSRRR